jgi:hypothetical protein
MIIGSSRKQLDGVVIIFVDEKINGPFEAVIGMEKLAC